MTASKPCYETGISAAPSAAAGRDEPESGKRKVAKQDWAGLRRVESYQMLIGWSLTYPSLFSFQQPERRPLSAALRLKNSKKFAVSVVEPSRIEAVCCGTSGIFSQRRVSGGNEWLYRPHRPPFEWHMDACLAVRSVGPACLWFSDSDSHGKERHVGLQVPSLQLKVPSHRMSQVTFIHFPELPAACALVSHSASRVAKGEHFHRALERHWV